MPDWIVPDWIGGTGEPTALRYRSMAEQEVRGISPSYEVLCLGVAEDPGLIALLDTLPPAKRQPNLLLAAVRFLGGPVSSWAAFRTFVLDRWSGVSATMAARRTQTNEPRRCATLLPALAALDEPLALLEVGTSAGLCLYPDRWSYRFTRSSCDDGSAGTTGEHLVGAGPQFSCAVTGHPPLPTRLPEVVWRGGLDLNPLDVHDGEDVRWLEALIWPEQTERFEILRSAVALARAEPARIVAGDLTTDLSALADAAPAGATLVVFHSAVLAYVDEPGRAAFADEVRALAARRPTVWLSNEAPGVVTGTERRRDSPSRFVLAQDGRPLALTGPHGHSLDWL